MEQQMELRTQILNWGAFSRLGHCLIVTEKGNKKWKSSKSNAKKSALHPDTEEKLLTFY